jgi:hypothetical protein
MSYHQSITRRRAIKTLGAAALASLPGPFQTLNPLSIMSSAADSHPSSKPTLHAYSDYGWLRGFSVIPSWAARIEDAWWFYDPARMREEVALATQVHANCIRLWIEFTAWMRDPDKITAHFMDAVAAIGDTGMKVMPCLFNRWHDSRYDYGGTYTENLFASWDTHVDYLRAIVTPLAADERILIWDLCNEPQGSELSDPVCKKQFEWLSKVAATVRACGARQPITMGTMNGGNIDLHAPLVDVLCGHPYPHDRATLVQYVGGYEYQRKKFGKPLLVNETIPGCLDDQIRADTARYFTEILSAAGTGWMGWALREGLAISTRKDRHDNNGINGQGYHPFFTKEGRLRDHLEFLTEKPKLLPPWQK